jgi:nucleoside-diphosphate-sugar epimerase
MPSGATLINVLVTGGKGFLGKAVVAAIRARTDYCVTIFDRDGWTGARRPEWDGIIHLAALPRVSDCETDPQECMRSNVLLTAQMLQERFRWFVMASTMTGPVNYYGLSKRFSEELAQYECKKKQAALRVLRFGNITGEGENPNKLLARAVEHVKTGAPFTLNEGALPAEFVSLERAVNEVMVASVDCNYRIGTVHTAKKVVDGVIRNKTQLMNWARGVADSDKKAA